jgi:hypothetical protein
MTEETYLQLVFKSGCKSPYKEIDGRWSPVLLCGDEEEEKPRSEQEEKARIKWVSDKVLDARKETDWFIHAGILQIEREELYRRICTAMRSYKDLTCEEWFNQYVRNGEEWENLSGWVDFYDSVKATTEEHDARLRIFPNGVDDDTFHSFFDGGYRVEREVTPMILAVAGKIQENCNDKHPSCYLFVLNVVGATIEHGADIAFREWLTREDSTGVVKQAYNLFFEDIKREIKEYDERLKNGEGMPNKETQEALEETKGESYSSFDDYLKEEEEEDGEEEKHDLSPLQARVETELEVSEREMEVLHALGVELDIQADEVLKEIRCLTLKEKYLRRAAREYWAESDELEKEVRAKANGNGYCYG